MRTAAPANPLMALPSTDALLMLEAEQMLCVVMEDLVSILLGQPHPFDKGESLLVFLPVLQDRIVAACHQVIRPKASTAQINAGFDP